MIRGNKYEGSGMTVSQIRAAELRECGSWAPQLTSKENREYSLLAAIRSLADERFTGATAGFEREVSAQIEKNLPANIEKHGGIYVPMRGLHVQLPERALVRSAAPTVLTAGTTNYGAETVFVQPQEFIDLLRNSMKCRALGATILSGLTGNIAFPRQTSAGELIWTAEAPGSDINDSALTLDQLILSPKSALSTSGYSRQLLRQSSLDVEMLVRQDLAEINALGIDRVCIKGGGTHEPIGILSTPGIGSVEMGEAGGVPTFGKIIDLMTSPDQANVQLVTPGFLTTPALRGALKQRPIIAGYPRFVWADDGTLAGIRAEASNQVPSDLTKEVGSSLVTGLHALIFGNWRDLIIGEWGVLEILVDPYSRKKEGVIELTSFVMVDVAVRHPVSFAAALDCKLN